MSDLQCPVRVLLAVRDESSTELLARTEAAERVALRREVETADGLNSCLEEIVDTHRGETVLITGSAQALASWRGPASPRSVIVLEGDASGWRKVPSIRLGNP